MRNDIDLVLELDDLLFTDKDTDAISSPILWYKYRRTHNDTRIQCSGCNPDSNGVIEGQLGCPYCKGKGYLWDQQLIKGYLYKANENKDRYNLNMYNKLGKSDTTSFILITPFDIKPKIEDTISILGLDDNGMIKVPLIEDEKLRVVYSRLFKASRSKDYFVTYLGG